MGAAGVWLGFPLLDPIIGVLIGIGATTGFTFLLADIRLAQGRLRDAMRTCQQGLRLVVEPGNPLAQGTAELHVILSEVYLEQGDLEAAAQHLLRSKELGEVVTLQEARHRWTAAKALLEAALGNLELALDLLDQAERLAAGGPAPEYRPIAALKARVWMRQDKAAAALEWARERGLSVDDELSFCCNFKCSYSSTFSPYNNQKQHHQPTPKCLYGDTVVQVYYMYIEQVVQTAMTGHNRYKMLSNELESKPTPSQPVVYQIRIKGHLGDEWTNWFGGLSITLEANGDTLLTGPVVDQAVLHGLLKKVRDLGMPLVSVSPVEPRPSQQGDIK